MTTEDDWRADVSVVIPCYRCAATLERAVASVAAQTRPPRELILVDDGSDDDTPGVAGRLLERYGADWIRLLTLASNQGPAHARNVGWDAATRPYVAFLDADDSWHPLKLQLQHQWMLENPAVALTGHPFRWLKEGDSAPALAGPLKARRIAGSRLLLSNPFPTPCVMLQRALPFRFASRQRHSEDYLLWLRIVLSGYSAFLLDLPLTFLHKAPYGEAGLSARLWRMELGEIGAYTDVRTAKLISGSTYGLVVAFSLLKFCRRWLLTEGGRLIQRHGKSRETERSRRPGPA
jgi:glycosyltransferase involved in cell wall biosynthesis